MTSPHPTRRALRESRADGSTAVADDLSGGGAARRPAKGSRGPGIQELFDLVMPALAKKANLSRDVERLFKECGVGDIRLRALNKLLDDNVPLDISEDDLDETGLSKVLARLIGDEITRNLN